MAAVGLSVVFVLINIGSVKCLLPRNLFRPKDEINPKPYSFESEIDSARLEQNVRAITVHDQVYLLFARYDIKHRDALIEELKKSGSVSVTINVYQTLLYSYRRVLSEGDK